MEQREREREDEKKSLPLVADLSHCWHTVSLILGKYIFLYGARYWNRVFLRDEMKCKKNKCTTNDFYIIFLLLELHYFFNDYAQFGESEGKKKISE